MEPDISNWRPDNDVGKCLSTRDGAEKFDGINDNDERS
jgi:hypothetical protein